MPKAVEISVDEFLDKRSLVAKDGVVYRAAKMPKTFDTESRSAVFVMTDETVDSYGDIVKANGADLDRFDKNPICLLNHRSDMPIGTWSDVKKIAKRVEGRATIAEEGTAPHVDMTFNLMRQGILRAASIGFIPTKVQRRLDEDGEPLYSYLIEEYELFECSVVSVPANSAALARAMEMGDTYARDTLEEILDTYTKTSTGLIVAKADLEAAYAEGSKNKTSTVIGRKSEDAADETNDTPAEFVTNDLSGMSLDAINRAASRGVVFCTEAKHDEKTYAGDIIAASWDDAEAVAEKSGHGETIIGQLIEMGYLDDEVGDALFGTRSLDGRAVSVKMADRDGTVALGKTIEVNNGPMRAVEPDGKSAEDGDDAPELTDDILDAFANLAVLEDTIEFSLDKHALTIRRNGEDVEELAIPVGKSIDEIRELRADVSSRAEANSRRALGFAFIDIDTTEAMEKAGALEKILTGLAERFPSFFPKAAEERVEPTMEKAEEPEPKSPPTEEEKAAALAEAREVAQRVSAKLAA